MDFDEAELDMIRRGDMLGPKLGAKVATALETLQRERDSALEAEDEAKDCFWAVYPTYIEARGRGISTEAARTQIVRERDEAREALKPFAEAADAYDDPSDEDDAGLAWAHDFTIGSLRRARAALTKGE